MDTEEKKRMCIRSVRGGTRFFTLIKWRILSYFGPVMRKEEDCLEKEIVLGTVPEARKQGRPKMRWIGDMEKWAKMSFEKLA